MRADMAKVIVERPRRDHGGSYPRGKLKGVAGDLDSAPIREAMGRGYATKSLNENLQPLQRYIARQVGRPWRLVYSEIAQRLSVRSAVQKHVLDHLREIVVESVWRQGDAFFHADRFGGGRPLESLGSWKRYYVCPRTGIHRIAPRPRKPVSASHDVDRRVVDGTREFRRLNGVWFEVAARRSPSRMTLVPRASMSSSDVLPNNRAPSTGGTSSEEKRSRRHLRVCGKPAGTRSRSGSCPSASYERTTSPALNRAHRRTDAACGRQFAMNERDPEGLLRMGNGWRRAREPAGNAMKFTGGKRTRRNTLVN